MSLSILPKKTLLSMALTFFLIALGSCEKKKTVERTDLILQVVPNEALLLPSSQSSCVDFAQAADPRPRSISEEWFRFSSFQLRWTNTKDTLIITSIRIVVNNANIEGGKYESTIAGDELDALIGYTGGAVPPADAAATCANTDGTVINGCREILSNKPSTKSISVSCGLIYGGVKIIDKTRAFDTQGTIAIEGYVQSADQSTFNRFKYTKTVTLHRSF